MQLGGGVGRGVRLGYSGYDGERRQKGGVWGKGLKKNPMSPRSVCLIPVDITGVKVGEVVETTPKTLRVSAFGANQALPPEAEAENLSLGQWAGCLGPKGLQVPSLSWIRGYEPPPKTGVLPLRSAHGLFSEHWPWGHAPTLFHFPQLQGARGKRKSCWKGGRPHTGGLSGPEDPGHDSLIRSLQGLPNFLSDSGPEPQLRLAPPGPISK